MIPFFGVHSQQPVASAGSFPTVVNVTDSNFSSAVTTHNVSMPATVTNGNLLFVFWTHDNSHTVTPQTAGWTMIVDIFASAVVSAAYFYKVSNGTEGGTTVNFLTSSTARATGQVYQISGWSGNTADIQYGTNQTIGSPTNLRPVPVITPAFGAANALWFIIFGKSHTQTVTAPAGWTNVRETIGGTGTTGAQMTVGRAEMNVASNTAQNWTMSATNTIESMHGTVAIKGL